MSRWRDAVIEYLLPHDVVALVEDAIKGMTERGTIETSTTAVAAGGAADGDEKKEFNTSAQTTENQPENGKHVFSSFLIHHRDSVEELLDEVEKPQVDQGVISPATVSTLADAVEQVDGADSSSVADDLRVVGEDLPQQQPSVNDADDSVSGGEEEISKLPDTDNDGKGKEKLIIIDRLIILNFIR